MIVGLIINRHRNNLKKAKAELQKQKQEIIKINNDLSISNQAKDRILSVIGHDLRSPVGGLKSILELYLQLPDLNENDINKLLNAALDASSNTYLLLENLLTCANSQRGEIMFRPKNAIVYPLIQETLEVLTQTISTKI